MHKKDRTIAKEIYLKHNKEISLVEIAEKLNKSPGTIRFWKHADNWDNKETEIALDKNSQRYRAMEIYLDNNKEIALSDIAIKLELPEGTIRSWKHRDGWDEKIPTNSEDWLKRENTKHEINKTTLKVTEKAIGNILNEINHLVETLKPLKHMGEIQSIDVTSSIYDKITNLSNGLEDSQIIKPILKGFIEALSNTEEYADIKERKHIDENTRYRVLERAGFKCQACGTKPRKGNDVTLHIDHILPHSLGGSDDDNNLQVLCGYCNKSKGNNFIINHNKNWEKRA